MYLVKIHVETNSIVDTFALQVYTALKWNVNQIYFWSAQQKISLSRTPSCTLDLCSHRRSQGVQWVHLHPQFGEKNFSDVIYRENV